MALTMDSTNRTGLGKMTLHFKLENKKSATITVWCSRYNRDSEKNAQVYRFGTRPTHVYWNGKLSSF